MGLANGESSKLLIGNSGNYWNLPVLSSLVLQAHSIRPRIHPTFLQQCPQLISIFLDDIHGENSFDDMEYWKPVKLPRLVSLILRGASTISFNPRTLKHTPEMETLDIQLYSVDAFSFIPPSEAFEAVEQEETSNGGVDDEESSFLALRLANQRRHV
ncbi:hypothetical protein BGZ47_000673 [Haplosporangium gracile]|nr:hypothetical protein BGZ47_000673 [Haplosporangium gracile]